MLSEPYYYFSSILHTMQVCKEAKSKNQAAVRHTVLQAGYSTTESELSGVRERTWSPLTWQMLVLILALPLTSRMTLVSCFMPFLPSYSAL